MAANHSTKRIRSDSVLSGTRFGRLVTEEKNYPWGTAAIWTCRCDCGQQKRCEQSALKAGRITDCGLCSQANEVRPNTPLIGADGHDWSWAFAIFKPIEGWPGYLVSSLGDVWSLKNDRPWHKLRPFRHPCGYLQVDLSQDNKRVKFYVHALVLTAFIGPCSPGQEARHDPDYNKTNNALSNLKWGTPLDNAADRERHGRQSKGENHHSAKLTQADVDEIRAQLRAGVRQAVLALKFGVRSCTIGDIIKGRCWKDS